jgi:polyphosphate:AMP phosphotransferase
MSMLEQVDLKQKLSRKEYRARIPALRDQLYELQKACSDAQMPVVVIFEGWDAVGKGDLIETLIRQLDPRGFKLYSIQEPRTYETHMPWLWRFWLKLPNYGQIAMFDQSWYRRVLVERVEGVTSETEWRKAYNDIVDLERAIADDGCVTIKFWLHIGKKEQKQRLEKLEKDPLTAWRVQPGDLKRHKQYDEYLMAVEEMLERTDTEWGPWSIVEATNRRWARVRIFETVIGRLDQALRVRRAAITRLGASPSQSPTADAPQSAAAACILETVDLDKRLTKEEYRRDLIRYQVQLRELAFELYRQKRTLLVVYEGWDAAGKGGNIKRVTERLDPRGYEVFPIPAPRDEDATHHYLWRFWRRLKPPDEKQILVFDRSWYGRVLVERVEGLCTEEEWRRAYREMNAFERQLVDSGMILAKFWIHVSAQEQLRRFQQRLNTPYKQWKLTEDDWRNREKWDRYEVAVDDMLLKTSTVTAPWTIVEGNDKWYARIRALHTLTDVLSKQLDYQPSDPGAKDARKAD